MYLVIRLFPSRRAWGHPDWRCGAHIRNTIPLDKSITSFLSIEYKKVSDRFYFGSVNGSSFPHWTITFEHIPGYHNTQSDLYWEPFMPSSEVEWDKLRRMTMRGSRASNITDQGHLINRVTLGISSKDSKKLKEPAEFVLRVWDSVDTFQLNKPLDLQINGSTSNDKDGELMRWKIDLGRSKIDASAAPLGLYLIPEQLSISTISDPSSRGVQLMFDATPSPPGGPSDLVPLKNVLGRVLSLEMIPLKTDVVEENWRKSSSTGPVSISTALLVCTFFLKSDSKLDFCNVFLGRKIDN